jgi:hypothetical protein
MWILSILSFVAIVILKIIGGIVLTCLGCFALSLNWKIRYAAPICFFSLFSVFSLILLILFKHQGDSIQLFLNGHWMPNVYAQNVFCAAGMFSGVITFLLIIIIWAVRNGEGIDLL